MKNAELINKYRCYNHLYYIECGDGWYDLLDEVGRFLSDIPHCSITEVKEKFGALRIYYSYSDHEGTLLLNEATIERINKFIATIENVSRFFCEDCGIKLNDNNKAKRQNVYWKRNICERCHVKQ